MDEEPDDLAPYKGSFEFLRSLGMGGAELVDFIKTYGIEVAAVQLRIKAQALRKFLHSSADLQHVGAALREVHLRRAGKRVALTPVQRTNFNILIDNIRALVGTAPLARRLGLTRQAIYAIVAAGGPVTATSFVASVAQLLNYNTMTGFLSALQDGVPGHTAIKRKDFKQPQRLKRKRDLAAAPVQEAT